MDNLIQFPGKKRSPAKGFQTPVSKTGVKMTEERKTIEVGVDWISGTVDVSNFSDLMHDLSAFFNDEFVEQKGGIGFYQDSYRSVLGIVVGLRPHEASSSRSDVYFSIPGRVLGAVTQQQVYDLMVMLRTKYNFHYSRLDLKLDDYTKTITPSLAYKAMCADQVSGFKVYRFLRSGSRSKPGHGETLELGRRGKNGSGKFLRIYDKSFQSNGEIDSIRVELELSQKKAINAAQVLSMCPFEDFQNGILLLISSAVDFIDRDNSGRKDRAKRLDWWDFVISSMPSISLSTPRITPSLQGVKTWLDRQVSPMIATVMNSFDTADEFWAYFWQMLEDGERRMRERHQALIAVAKMQNAMQLTT